MKLTKQQLREMIREEVSRTVLNEQDTIYPFEQKIVDMFMKRHGNNIVDAALLNDNESGDVLDDMMYAFSDYKESDDDMVNDKRIYQELITKEIVKKINRAL